jgi:hypothetical protein
MCGADSSPDHPSQNTTSPYKAWFFIVFITESLFAESGNDEPASNWLAWPIHCHATAVRTIAINMVAA